MNIIFKIKGLNGSPQVKITCNNQILYDELIHEGQVQLNFNILPIDKNTLQVEHYGKRFGENRCWDHQELIIEDILFDDVSIKPIWSLGEKYYLMKEGQIKDSIGPVDMVFGFNGYFTIDFLIPVYDWIISNRVNQAKSIQHESKFQYYDSFYHVSDKALDLIKTVKENIDKL